MLDPEVESRPWEEQLELDHTSYRAQLAYLLERSPFYREKLGAAGIRDAAGAGSLAEIARLPLTEKRELRETATSENPIGTHLCASESELVRIYSTSGTTGTPSYIPLTARDLDDWITGSARSYAASGVTAGQRVVSTFNAGPFVAGAALASFERIGLCHIPVGTGNTERLLLAIELLRPDAAVLTPSYAAHLAEVAVERGFDLPGSSVERVLVAGEPGGGESSFRTQLEAGWGARVTEAMGIGDIGISLWGECEEQDGMHLGARGFVHPELVDPESGDALDLVDGASGELVLTHLRHRAAPLLRFRTRDHVVVRTSPCACGRSGPRVRCLGRTDDMLIVRGVNVFPLTRFARGSATPSCSRRASTSCRGGPCAGASTSRNSSSGRRAIRPRGRQMQKIQSQGVHHITLVGADRQTSIDFWEGVLGMPFVFEQPNLDNESESHLYFDPGDGRLITVFTNEERGRVPNPAPREPGNVHHLAFALSQATFRQVVERLDERGIRHSGVKDRGFMDSVYFDDPLGLLVELASYRFEPPHPHTHADVLLEAHRIRVERGDYNIAESHLADAIEALVTRSRGSLSDDRSPKDPYVKGGS